MSMRVDIPLMVSYYSHLLFPEHFDYTSHSTKLKAAPQHMT